MWTRLIVRAGASSIPVAPEALYSQDKSNQNPGEVKIAAVQMLGYDKTDLPRPGYDPSEKVVSYIEKAAHDGAQLVVFPEYLLGRITVAGPETERISKAAAAGRIYVIVGCWEVHEDQSFANTALLFDRSGKIAGKYHKVHAAVDQYEGDPPWSQPPSRQRSGPGFSPTTRNGRCSEGTIFRSSNSISVRSGSSPATTVGFRNLFGFSRSRGPSCWSGSMVVAARWRTSSSGLPRSKTKWRW